MADNCWVCTVEMHARRGAEITWIYPEEDASATRRAVFEAELPFACLGEASSSRARDVRDAAATRFVVASGEHYALRSAVTLATLEIQEGGSVAFDPAGAPALNATSVAVYGALAIGSERCAFDGTTTITLRGAKPAAPTLATKAVIVYAGGTLDVHGAPYAPTWTRLAQRLTDEVGDHNTGLNIEATEESQIDEAFDKVAGAMQGGAAG